MNITRPLFAIEVPDGFVVQREADPFSAFSVSAQCEITVAVGVIAPEADVEEALALVDDANRRALRTSGPSVRFMPAPLAPSPGRSIVGSIALGGFARFSACFVVAHTRAVAGSRYFANVAFHQHQGGAGPADVAAFIAFCERCVQTFVLLPEAGAIEEALARRDGEQLDVRRLYPYVVTESYFTADIPRHESSPIGHGLWLMFAEDNGGAARIMTPARARVLGGVVDPEKIARTNLAEAARGGVIPIGLATARDGQPMLLLGPHWLAASCLFLPGLRELACAHLQTSEVLACAPHRDILYVIPAGDVYTRRRLREEIETSEGDDPRPLTFEWFRLTSAGCERFGLEP